MSSLILRTIIHQLNQYIRSVSESGMLEPGRDLVELGNIAATKFAGGTIENLNEKVVASLVNISEEASLKNNVQSRQINQQYLTFYPVVHVNLYLLFTANFENYDTAINQLFRVLEFFQGRKIFKFKNAPLAGLNNEERDRIGEIELTVELHTLTFEQLNDLWGSLGGKQLPFVMYRARLFPIQMEQPIGSEGMITEIDLATHSFK